MLRRLHATREPFELSLTPASPLTERTFVSQLYVKVPLRKVQRLAKIIVLEGASHPVNLSGAGTDPSRNGTPS